MTGYLNRLAAVFGWAALMAIVWELFTPRPVSATTFTMMSATGALLLFVGLTLWGARRPAPAVSRARYFRSPSEDTK